MRRKPWERRQGFPRRRPSGLRFCTMSRVPTLSSPFLLGFDEIDRAVGRVTRSVSEGYPPYNIERLAATSEQTEMLRITLAVAGFARSELDVTVEDGQLLIRGRQAEDRERVYLHRGIAARQFQRVFLLAEGMKVAGADLVNGLLSVDLFRPERQKRGETIDITVRD